MNEYILALICIVIGILIWKIKSFYSKVTGIITIYTDGSEQTNYCSIGVYSNIEPSFNYSAVLAEENKNCVDGEVRALIKALSSIPWYMRWYSTVVIATDLNSFKSVFMYLKKSKEEQKELDRTWAVDTVNFIHKYYDEFMIIRSLASKFWRGVTFLYVPGHSRFIGNEVADTLSKLPRYGTNVEQLIWNKMKEMKGSKEVKKFKLCCFKVTYNFWEFSGYEKEIRTLLVPLREMTFNVMEIEEKLFPNVKNTKDDQRRLENLLSLMKKRSDQPVDLRNYLACQ